MKKKLKKLIEKHLHKVEEHFDKYGWGLSLDCIKHDIVYELTGVDIMAELMKELKGKARIVYRNGDFVALSKEGYFPIYMNIKSGKLKVIENADVDKSYIMTHREVDGWEYIGKL